MLNYIVAHTQYNLTTGLSICYLRILGAITSFHCLTLVRSYAKEGAGEKVCEYNAISVEKQLKDSWPVWRRGNCTEVMHLPAGGKANLFDYKYCCHVSSSRVLEMLALQSKTVNC